MLLSPEVPPGKDMRALVDAALYNDFPALQMHMPSSSLIDGVTGFVKQRSTSDTIRSSIMQSIEFTHLKANINSCTTSEAAVLLENRTNA